MLKNIFLISCNVKLLNDFIKQIYNARSKKINSVIYLRYFYMFVLLFLCPKLLFD